ncbi:dTDP-4-dehydrorhamnose 3,5-epimerase family protein [Cellulomonas wangleii]|uniref:dTDP-4-dehydrorhamnose 3,5-epimerase family protein n=1 Tax=Cellulomonas wangleii TaxID=2816956 RepID=UPI0027DB6B0A|nr:dTDP-4-dehydrorhamnose 3,5-epimerase [Cellulomonas wangleii]
MSIDDEKNVADETGIDGLLVIRMKQAGDARGTVREFFRTSIWQQDELRSLVDGPWLQINVTETRRGAVRGLHAEAMNKLVGVVSGRAMGIYLDTREGSPTYGAVHTCTLEKGTQVFVPRGVGNGFQSLSDETQYLYCFDDEWRPGMPGTAYTPLSPDLRIEWTIPVDPDDPAQISTKDRDAPVWTAPER